MRLTLSALHLVALGIGLGAVWVRAATLRAPLDPPAVRRVLAADAWWGIAALVWLATGLARLFMGTEKATEYYLTNPLFHAKMGLFVLVLGLEMWPMLSMMKWRRGIRRGVSYDTGNARTLATISTIEALIVIAMVFVASAIARGYGARVS